jgi:hypothetical protein
MLLTQLSCLLRRWINDINVSSECLDGTGMAVSNLDGYPDRDHLYLLLEVMSMLFDFVA